MDKTIAFRNPFMDSAVLHVAPQRFPTTVLRLELERELDRLLREQIYERYVVARSEATSWECDNYGRN